MSASPPGVLAIDWVSWLSSMPVYISLPGPSNMPLLGMAARMLLSSCCMNSASNWLAALRMLPSGSISADCRSESSSRASSASPPAVPPGTADPASPVDPEKTDDTDTR
jgi:hypothetical protein